MAISVLTDLDWFWPDLLKIAIFDDLSWISAISDFSDFEISEISELDFRFVHLLY